MGLRKERDRYRDELTKVLKEREKLKTVYIAAIFGRACGPVSAQEAGSQYLVQGKQRPVQVLQANQRDIKALE